MLRKPNKIQMIIMSVILVLNTVFSAGLALATTTTAPTTASVQLTINTDATTKTAASGLSVGLVGAPVSTMIPNSPGSTSATVYKVTGTSGVFTFTNLTALGDYKIAITDANAQVTECVTVTVTKFNVDGKPTKATATWIDPKSVNTKKSGAIGGYVTDGNGNPAQYEYIQIMGSGANPVLWITSTDSYGAFKVYVPAAKGYTLGVGGNGDPSIKNTSYNVDVAAGQMSSPFADLTNNVTWANGGTTTAAKDPTLGLKTATISADAKTITGVANPKTQVVAETVYSTVYGDHSTTTMRVLGSATTTAAGKFKITLPTGVVPAGQCIMVTAVDNAGNMAVDPTYQGNEVGTPDFTTLTSNPSYVGLLTVTLTADKTATVATNFVIGVTKDTTNTFVQNVTRVVYNDGTNNYDLPQNICYTLTKGKLTILAGSVPQSPDAGFTFKIYSTGFTAPTNLTGQVVKASKTPPKGSTVLAGSLALGSTAGTTKLTVTSAVYSTDTFKVFVDTKAVTGFVNNIVPAGAIDITGTVYDNLSVGPSKKYIGLYEVDSTGRIYSFKAFTAAPATTKAPILSDPGTNALTVASSVYSITLKVDTQTLSTTAPAAAAFKVTVGTTKQTLSGVTITNNTDNTSKVVLTFPSIATGLKASDAVNVVYTKPASNPLKDVNGNVVATTTISGVTKSSDFN